jgi:hypothetical protein
MRLPWCSTGCLAVSCNQLPVAAPPARRPSLLLLLHLPQVCVATGRIIRDLPAVRCKVCRHSMVAAEVRARAACPLCHSDLYSSAGPAAASSASLRRSSTTGSGSGRSTAAKLGHSTSGGSSRGVQDSMY